MKRPQKQIEPTPPMPRGETEFEEKVMACDFQMVFTKMSNSHWSSLRDSYEYAYRAGYVSGKAKRQLEVRK